jgi:uncharacterized repeat protein (TIGR01451 family)
MTGTDPATGQPRDPIMFVSTEGTGGIEVINPVNLQFHGVAPGPVNMGGVDVDDVNNILFSIQRGTSSWGGSGTSNLYVYTYNDDGTGITPLANYTIPNHGYGMDLAFDDLRDVLWIGDVQYRMVKAYKKDNPTWTSIHEDTSLSFNVSHNPVDIAVDRQRNIVYTGGAWLGSYLLTKYDVSAGIESTVNTGFGVMGVAVDEVTGYVYLTRGGASGAGEGDVQVWDCSTSPFTLIQDTPNIGNPAGIAIGNVSYNPLNLAKNDTVQGYGVHIGQTFTYEITYDNKNNAIVATNVTAVDTLPPELDFVSETLNGVPGTGVYDAGAHTVTWDIGNLPAGDPGGLIELVVRVNQSAVGGTTIYNYCTIQSDQTPQTTVEGKDPDNPQPGEPGTGIICRLADLWAVEYRYGAPPPGYDMSNMPLFKSWLEVRIENQGSGDAKNVIAKLNNHKPANVTILPDPEDRVALGDIPAGSSAWSSGDTFTVIVDMSNQQDPNLGIHWDIEYDDECGNHHIVLDVPEFPWCPGGPTFAEILPVNQRLWYPQLTVSKLYPNYPNPFNPETWIPYQVAKDADVTVRIFDTRGQLIKTIALGHNEAGFYISIDKAAYWDGRNQFGEKVSSGVYFYTLHAGDFTATRKMVIMK